MRKSMILSCTLWIAVLLMGCASQRANAAEPADAKTSAPAEAAVQPIETAPVDIPAPAAAPVAEPQAMNVDELLDRMESVRKTVSTYSAKVLKLSETELTHEKESFEGTLQFKAPRLLRMELRNTASGEETIYIVGPEFGWIYRKYKEQAERGRLSEVTSEAEKGNPLEYGLTKDIHGLREGYILSLLPAETVGGRRTIPLQLAPEGGTSYTKGRIIFWIDLENWMPVQVREYKSNDETVETHTFTEIVLNKRIRDSVFEFNPPRDVEVILLDAL